MAIISPEYQVDSYETDRNTQVIHAHLKNEPCTIKIRKRSSMKREIASLSLLRGGPNIILLIDIIETSIGPGLVFEHVRTSINFAILDIKWYIREILKALKFCHDQGIIHRSINPRAILFDLERRILRLADFDQSVTYKSGNLNTRVGRSWYRSPELILGFQGYDFAIDMWSVGVISAELIFKTKPFFRGSSTSEIIMGFSNILGTEDLQSYLSKYDIDFDLSESHRRVNWEEVANRFPDNHATPEALDFIDQILRYDHQNRLSASEGLNHKFLLDQI